MIDHLGLNVSDYERSKAFYQAALKPLGYELLMEFDTSEVPGLSSAKVCGLGVAGKPDLWLAPRASITPMHLCFRAPARGAVDAFYAAALGAGGKDNGKPGLRPHYHANYYGAFVLDPDGYNIEAVCHEPV
jgi:catechol 2,3-dioxygenase-like lactoylglutathione lyase family enzyme